MNARDLQNAARLWVDLPDTDERQIVETRLASQLRTTGLESTLRWLASQSTSLHDAFCSALNVPKDGAERSRRPNLEILADSRRALALVEALHIVARARQGKPS